MSAKRPPKRYVGFVFEPADARRAEVARAVERAWASHGGAAGKAPPRLLLCERGAGIVVVPRGDETLARAVLKAAPAAGGPRLTPLVTSGTIAAVKRALKAHGAARGP